MQDSTIEMRWSMTVTCRPPRLVATPEVSSSPTAGKRCRPSDTPGYFQCAQRDNPRDPSQMGPGWPISAARRRLLQTAIFARQVYVSSHLTPSSPQKTTKPGWLARLSLCVDLVRSILFRSADPECQNLAAPKFSLSLAPTLRRGVTGPHRSPPQGSEGRQLLHYQRKVLQFIL